MLEDPADGYILGFSLRISAVCVEIAFYRRVPRDTERTAEK